MRDTPSTNPDNQQTSSARKSWSEHEVRLLVADYFDMLSYEMADQPYQKSAHRKMLLPKLNGRSDGSVEYKHQNVSAVLIERGLPYIEGYKPHHNYQAMLATEVESYLDRHADLLTNYAASPRLNPAEPLISNNLTHIFETPPDKIVIPRIDEKPWDTRRIRRVDFAELDARNRRLGILGEQFVVELEKFRLLTAGRDDLAQKVLWASREIGDGLGYDILSFNEVDDSEKLLEVKATGLGKFFPFYVTSNEVRCSEDIANRYHLYRVFNFGVNPRVYILSGSLRQHCQLEPVVYRAAL